MPYFNLRSSKVVFLGLVILFSFFRIDAQPRFISPIAGVYGKQYIIVNYVDWAADTFFKDNHCGSKTYDSHEGTDFAIRDFAAMDSGVAVNAVDNGRVIFVQDGLFDREKTSVLSKKLGNYIGITHAGKLQTYYGHLRKNSILVKVGDSVIAGQKIGLVGSSGNSESPHLHFELWYDSTNYIDPFSGPCGHDSTYWITEPKYDTSYASWTAGMTNFICTLDTLEEGLKNRDTFYASDPAITYWNLQYGLRKGDSLRIDWIAPNSNLWFRYGYELSRDWWYYYYSSYINAPTTGVPGKWTAKLYRNNVLVASRSFYFFNRPSSVNEMTQTQSGTWFATYAVSDFVVNTFDKKGEISIFNLQGKLLVSAKANSGETRVNGAELPTGIYLVVFDEKPDSGRIQNRYRKLIQVF
ncbi:MAG: peptidoglycan DD-metalloendopeptidase family protein [Chitinophagaceae bacterium]